MLVDHLKLEGGVKVWMRTDPGTRCYKTSGEQGPDWKDVRGRVTVAMGNVVN